MSYESQMLEKIEVSNHSQRNNFLEKLTWFQICLFLSLTRTHARAHTHTAAQFFDSPWSDIT